MESLPQQPPPQNQMGYEVEIYLQCKKLKDLDVLSKSDPKIVVYLKEGKATDWTKIGETEVLKNNLNPDFKTPIKVFYQFEIHQNLKFEVQDYDSKGSFDLIGNVETSLGNVVGSKDFIYESDIKLPNKTEVRGRLVAKVVPIQTSNLEIIFKVGARNLRPVAGCCGSTFAPAFDLNKVVDVGGKKQYSKVYSSEVLKNTTPSFVTVKISASTACNGDIKNPVQFKFINKVDGVLHAIGAVERDFNSLKEEKEIDILDQTGAKAGVMIVEQLSVREKPTIMQYLQIGWQISLGVAIDFTGSNGNPSDPSSLHFLGAFNQYESAAMAIGSILEPYDSDRQFPVYGFGGVPNFMNIHTTDHCFPLNGNYDNPEVPGVQGILQAYRTNLPRIELSGPTYFSHILKQIIAIVKARSTQTTYNIFLILTDGEIHDMDETKSLIVEAALLPLSIIIVGVGNEKFKLMKELDGDKNVLRDSQGRTGVRDIVQFVKFKKTAAQGPHALAQQVLKEVPDQLVAYMAYKGIFPPGYQ